MIFLDLVGTITDTESDREGMVEIGRRIKEKYSLSDSPEEIWDTIAEIRRPQAENRHIQYIPFRYITADAVFLMMSEKCRRKMSDDEIGWVERIYTEAQVSKARLARNALEGIEKMRSLADHLGVISDADTIYLHEMLKALGVHDYFDSITSSEEAGYGKPNPKIFELALERAGNPESAVHIGDSEKRDVGGALSMGLIPIRIAEKGTESRAAYVAKDLLDAAEWLEKHYKGEGS